MARQDKEVDKGISFLNNPDITRVYSSELIAVRIKTSRPDVTDVSAETEGLPEYLRDNGYFVLSLTGKTPVALRIEGMRFSYLGPALEHVSASPSLVAFKPYPFLKESFNASNEKQLRLLAAVQKETEEEFPGAGLIVRTWRLSELLEVGKKFFEATGIRILGIEHGHPSTWVDYQAGGKRASVGPWLINNGLDVRFRTADDIDWNLGLAVVTEIPRK